MTIELKPQQERRIDEAMRSGAYSNHQEVIDQALEMLRERDEFLFLNQPEIEAHIQRGLDELDRGEGIPEDQLDQYLKQLKAQPD